jgi:hypothetical protein
MTRSLRLAACGVAALVGLVASSAPAAAQATKTAALAKELVTLMDQAKLSSFAANVNDDEFVATLYIPGASLLVVSGKYSAPQAMQEMITQKTYQEVYQELQGAATAGSKIFITDVLADGIKMRPQNNQGADAITDAERNRTAFDGDPGKQKLSDADYEKRFSAAETAYTAILNSLLQNLKKTAAGSQ